MKSPHFDFGNPEPDRRPVTIRTRRSMLLRPIGGDLRHVESGSTITITRHDAGNLGADDYTLAPPRRKSLP